MDLGALVCTPREPACLVCPVSKLCQARQLGLQDRLPAKAPKPLPLAVTEAAVVMLRQGRVSDPRARARGPLGAILGIPDGAPGRGRIPPADRRARTAICENRSNASRESPSRIGPQVKTITYSVTKHRVKLFVHLAEASAGDVTPGPGLIDARWVRPEELGDYTFSSAGRRLIAWITERAAELIE